MEQTARIIDSLVDLNGHIQHIELLNITENPLSYMGKIAGICWKSPIYDNERNIKRAKDCIESEHGRLMEYVDVTFVIDGFSARCIRELYTHIIGTTRLQASTRYIDYENFQAYNPFEHNSDKAIMLEQGYEQAKDTYKELLSMGASKEDSANMLPIGMDSKMVLKINLRALVHFMNLRLCNRAYKEIRELAHLISDLVKSQDSEWEWIVNNLFVPKCKTIGYCKEKMSCGLMPKGLEGLKEVLLRECIKENK